MLWNLIWQRLCWLFYFSKNSVKFLFFKYAILLLWMYMILEISIVFSLKLSQFPRFWRRVIFLYSFVVVFYSVLVKFNTLHKRLVSFTTINSFKQFKIHAVIWYQLILWFCSKYFILLLFVCLYVCIYLCMCFISGNGN